MLKSLRKTGLMLTTAAAMAFGASNANAEVKNVIIMISDGQGFNTVQATDYYTGMTAAYESFDVKLAMQTSSANNPAGYNPSSMAGNFNYAKSGATDSASAATAMYTGEKNYDGQINWSTSGQAMTTIFEKAAQSGRNIGAVSTVQLSHATPAAVYGHNSSRNNYAEIAKEAVYGSNPNSHNGNYDADNYNGKLKVVMGAGHPDYNSNGAYSPSATDNYVGGAQAWTDLGNGVNGWTRVDAKADFESLVSGPTPDKVFGVVQNNSTNQYDRNGKGGLNDKSLPYDDALLGGSPSLSTMTLGAINVLDNGGKGFALMVEGGAIDWANHADLAGRMIEEQIDFNNAVASVVGYLNNNTNGNNWSNTLLIVTADHECGHLWGDGSAGFFDVNKDGVFTSGVDYAHVANNGVGVLPGVRYHSTDHTNALVPFYAHGAGAEMFADYVAGTDSNLASLYNLDCSWTGQYIDNTAIHDVLVANSVPEPATMGLVLLGGIGALLRRRK